MFALVTWTPTEVKFLADRLFDFQKKKLLFDGATFKTEPLKEIASLLTNAFQKPFCYKKVFKKCESLKDTFYLWNTVQYWPGVTVNMQANTLVTDASTWEAILKEHPNAKQFRNAPQPLLSELVMIFSRMHAEEEHKRVYASCYLQKPKVEPPEVICIEDDDEDEDEYVKDEQSCIEKTMSELPSLRPSAYAGKSSLEASKAQFHAELDCQVSGVSSVGSSMWP